MKLVSSVFVDVWFAFCSDRKLLDKDQLLCIESPKSTVESMSAASSKACVVC